jgi:predicted naringenin-chalcone synthase
MSMAVQGIGTAVPTCSIAQEDAAHMALGLCCTSEEQGRLLQAVYRRSGVRQRASVVLENGNGAGVHQSFYPTPPLAVDRGPTTRARMDRYCDEARDLALRSAREAIEGSPLSPDGITHLITVSCSGFHAPGIDVALIKGLGLAPTVRRTHVGFMGCHGAFNGLQVAQALADSDPHARVLLCAVELCSLHLFCGWDLEKIVANALFADGAAAVVGVPRDLASPDSWRLAATGSCLIPDSEDAMTWRIGDFGFEMTLSNRVPALIRENLRPWLERWLEECGLRLDDVRSWAVHPGGPRILSAVEEALGLPSEALAASREALAEHGNMSSPTVLFILRRLRERGAPRPCVALGFGPGLAAEAALFV